MSRFKSCIKCKAVKPIKGYYAHPKMADGHLNKCKECCKSDATARRESKLEEIRAYDRERSRKDSRIAAAAEINRAWRQADRRRSAAHNAVARAIRRGELSRRPCEQCGAAKTVAHHDDYNKPLEVRWLCQPCHVRHHKFLSKLMVANHMPL